MNEWNRERRKLVIGFCVVCFLFALIIVVASLSRKYPKNEMTEYYTAGIQEMTFGEPVSFSELCPEFADFEKTHYAGKYTEREQLCKELWKEDSGFSSVFSYYTPLFIDETGKLHARETGCFTFRLCLSEPSDDGRGKEYTFQTDIAVTDKNYDDYIPWTNDLNTWDPYGKYILAEDVALTEKLSEEIYRAGFNGILVNPDGHTITSNYQSSLFENNRGIIDGIKVKGNKTSDGFFAFAMINNGIIRNCTFEGSAKSGMGAVWILSSDRGFCYGNTVKCTLYADRNEAYVFHFEEEDRAWNNDVYLDCFWQTDTINCAGRNLVVNPFDEADDQNGKNGNDLYSLSGEWIDDSEMMAVILDMYFIFTIPKGGQIDLQSYSEQILDYRDYLKVSHWLLNGERMDTLTNYRVETPVSLTPVIKYKETEFFYETRTDGEGNELDIVTGFNCADEEIILPDTADGFSAEIFDTLLTDEYQVIPKKLRFPREARALDSGILTPDGIKALHAVDRVEVETGNPSLFLLEDNLYTADGKKLLAHFGQEDETKFTARASVEEIGYNAFAPDNGIEIFHVENVSRFSSAAFVGCKSLSEIYFGRSVLNSSNKYSASLVYTLLSGSPNVRRVEIDGTNPDCYVKDSAVIDRRTASLIYYPRSVVGTVTLPEGIKRIENTCMQYCSMEKLVLPDSLLEFEENAVIHCPKLREIVFGACRVTIVAEPDDRAPEDFPALESVVFEGTEHLSCTEIAFMGANLKCISLPAALQSGEPFFDCALYQTEEGCAFEAREGVLYLGRELVAYPVRKANLSFEVLSGVETIGKKAFYRCENLTKIVLPDGLNSIGESAFAECDALTSVEIGTDLSEIASHAFADCGNLKSVTIAPTETGIALGEYAFSDCKNLIRLEQENYFVSLGDSAFSGTGFTDFTIGSNVKEMGAYCFSGAAVRTVTIESEAITSLPYGCFLNSALERIDLGLVTEIDDSVFSGCGKLTDIDFTFIQSIGASSFSGTAVEKVENEYLTSVPANAFKDCPNLTEAKLFNVDTVEWYAFDGCENLSLFVSQPLVSVGVYGFAECNLSSVSFSSAQSVLVGNCGFYGNTSLTELHFSAGADIRYRAFSHCEKLHSVKVQGGAKIGEAAFDNCLEFENLEISGGATIETGAFSSPYFDLVAPKALTISGGAEIAEGAFENGTGLETLKIYGDANIGFEAFKNYSTLREVEIEGSVKMGEGAFSRCPELKTVKFSGDTVILADYAFESCPSLEKVEISASEGRISFTAFSGPTQTIEVYLNSGKDYEWEGRVAENIVLYVPKELMTYILEWWQVDEEQVVEYDFTAA